jgi:hypothetical protein
MYFVNTFRWDYAKLAALVAPRPLLISNTDKDPIFPLEGVVDIHRQVRHVYQLYKAGDKLGLQITEGPHADTQELHLHAFRWFNRHFRNDLTMIEKTAVKFFEPPQLRVFADLPQDEVNTRIDEQFVAAAPSLSEQQLSEPMLLENITAKLLDRCFRAWPEAQDVSGEVRVEAGGTVQVNGTEQSVSRLTFESQPHVALQMDVLHGAGVSCRICSGWCWWWYREVRYRQRQRRGFRGRWHYCHCVPVCTVRGRAMTRNRSRFSAGFSCWG